MLVATLTSKGQITIPRAVRDKLHLHAGDKIDFSLLDDQEVLLRPITKSADEVFACLHTASEGRKASVQEMDVVLRKKMQDEFE
ncbi:MAG: AbrB/MazE/SpoVT family DNA-binding domain-containing protein [Gallionella sp.]